MQEKFLPFLKRPEKPRKNLEGQPYIPDKNLFYDPDSLREEATAAGVIIKFASGVIVFFSVVLILLLLIHTSMNFLVEEALNEQKNIVSKISAYGDLQVQGEDISAKIDYSKKAIAIRVPLTTRISFVMSRIPEQVSLEKIDIKSNGFNLSVRSSETSAITKMIMRWLQDGGISEVTLKEASYSAAKESYVVVLEGVYR